MNKKPNKKAFSELVEKHQAIIHKVTSVYCSNISDRDDLFQEICLQLWRSYPNFRQDAQFSTWMYRVALNTAISNIRKTNKQPHFEELRESDKPEENNLHNEEKHRLLNHAISKLNNIDKAIILLWLEEKNYEEIASIMGTSKNNVSVKLVRIKRKLEQIIH